MNIAQGCVRDHAIAAVAMFVVTPNPMGRERSSPPTLPARRISLALRRLIRLGVDIGPHIDAQRESHLAVASTTVDAAQHFGH